VVSGEFLRKKSDIFEKKTRDSFVKTFKNIFQTRKRYDNLPFWGIEKALD